jgi:hypothetical protein
VTGVFGLLKAASANIGPMFLLALLPVFLALTLVPVLIYHFLALRSASYTVMRDGIILDWGLRSEEIPMPSVLWVRPARELRKGLPLPWVYWPGAVRGVRRFGGSGQIEFMASTTRNLILIATPGRVFAISPADPNDFLDTFHRVAELGSLAPIPAKSLRSQLLFGRVWSSKPARVFILIGGLLTLTLLVWVSMVIPRLSETFLGFLPDGSPREPVPPVQLFLIPVLNGMIYLVDLMIGLFFYRRYENHLFAFLVWGFGMVVPMIFLLDVFFILRGG